MNLLQAEEIIRRHNDMVRQAGKSLAGRLAQMEQARQADRISELTLAVCEALPSEFREQRRTIAILCDALDERSGFLMMPPGALARAANEAFPEARFSAADVERCRHWLMHNGPIAGLAAFHAHEYRRCLLDLLAKGASERLPARKLARFLAEPAALAHLDALRHLAARLAANPGRRLWIGAATVKRLEITAVSGPTLARLYNLLPATPLE